MPEGVSEDGHEQDRRAILARRARFVALAVAGLGGCERSPSTRPLDVDESEQRCDMPEPEPEPVRRFDDPFSCDDPGLEPLPEPTAVPEELGLEARHALGKERYDEGFQAYQEGRYDDALIAWEASYALAPEHHLLAVQAADAAYRAGRRVRALELLRAVLDRPDLNPASEAASQAREQVLVIESYCASSQPCLSAPEPHGNCDD